LIAHSIQKPVINFDKFKFQIPVFCCFARFHKQILFARKIFWNIIKKYTCKHSFCGHLYLLYHLVNTTWTWHLNPGISASLSVMLFFIFVRIGWLLITIWWSIQDVIQGNTNLYLFLLFYRFFSWYEFLFAMYFLYLLFNFWIFCCNYLFFLNIFRGGVISCNFKSRLWWGWDNFGIIRFSINKRSKFIVNFIFNFHSNWWRRCNYFNFRRSYLFWNIWSFDSVLNVLIFICDFLCVFV